MTIVEFLQARLADAARAAESLPDHARHWTTDEIGSWVQLGEGDGSVPVSGYVWGEGVDAEAVAEHIARHDPARVLAEIEMKRRLVERAELVLNAEEGDLDPTSISGGKWLAIPAARQEQRLVLRTLAALHSDHPDYDPTWSPA